MVAPNPMGLVNMPDLTVTDQQRGARAVVRALTREVDAARVLLGVAPDLDWPARRELAAKLTLVRDVLEDARQLLDDAELVTMAGEPPC